MLLSCASTNRLMEMGINPNGIVIAMYKLQIY